MPKKEGRSFLAGKVAQTANSVNQARSKNIVDRINRSILELTFISDVHPDSVTQALNKFEEYLDKIKSDSDIKEELSSYLSNPDSDTLLAVDDNMKLNALHLCLLNAADPKITESLIELGFLVTTKGEITSNSAIECGTPLQYAYQTYCLQQESSKKMESSKINLAIVTDAIKQKFENNWQTYVTNESENTIFHVLSTKFNNKTFDILQNLNSINPNWKNFQHPDLYNHQSSLMLALKRGNFSYASILLDLGALINLKDSLGENALFSIIRYSYPESMVEENLDILKQYELRLFQKIYSEHNWEDDMLLQNKIDLLTILNESDKTHIKNFLTIQTNFATSTFQEYYDKVMQNFKESLEINAKNPSPENQESLDKCTTSLINTAKKLKEGGTMKASLSQRIEETFVKLNKDGNGKEELLANDQKPIVKGYFNEKLTKKEAEDKIEILKNEFPDVKFEMNYLKGGEIQISASSPEASFTNTTTTLAPKRVTATPPKPEVSIKNLIKALIDPERKGRSQ